MHWYTDFSLDLEVDRMFYYYCYYYYYYYYYYKYYTLLKWLQRTEKSMSKWTLSLSGSKWDPLQFYRYISTTKTPTFNSKRLVGANIHVVYPYKSLYLYVFGGVSVTRGV